MSARVLIFARIADYMRLARLHSPAGALLLLWPTLWGLWVAAEGFPGWYWLGVIVAGVFVMRSFGCVINDMCDKNLDAVVARTRGRPLAAGRISRAEAAAVAGVFLAAALWLWWLLPPPARWWAAAAAAAAVVYPAAKRFVPLPQGVLAVAFSFGIPVAAAAVTGAHPPLRVWWFFAANCAWVVAYDTIYAMADRAGDRAHGGVYSAALLFGARDIKVTACLYALTVVWLSAAGIVLGYGAAYQVALMAAMVCAFRFWSKYKTRRPDACMAAFRANHWFGLYIFAGIAAEHWRGG